MAAGLIGSQHELQTYIRVPSNRSEALFAAWYEFFPARPEGKPNSDSKSEIAWRIDRGESEGFDSDLFPYH